LSWIEFESGIFQLFYPIICSCGESHFLILWCVGDKCDMAGSEEDLGRSRMSDVEDRGWPSIGQVLGG
jgi:hypothetical protein